MAFIWGTMYKVYASYQIDIVIYKGQIWDDKGNISISWSNEQEIFVETIFYFV